MRHIEANMMALFFEIRKRFIVRLRARRQETSLKSASLIQGSGRDLRDYSTGSSWTMDALPLKGCPCSGLGLLLVLWFYGKWGWRNLGSRCHLHHCLLCNCFGCMTCRFALLSLRNNPVSYRKQDNSQFEVLLQLHHLLRTSSPLLHLSACTRPPPIFMLSNLFLGNNLY